MVEFIIIVLSVEIFGGLIVGFIDNIVNYKFDDEEYFIKTDIINWYKELYPKLNMYGKIFVSIIRYLLFFLTNMMYKIGFLISEILRKLFYRLFIQH